ncbi:uncharacterized protein BJ212DRAFT_1487525 [Suillus subaureus]|uniref:Uncharacterized protein n=1 Tax=Suillus subaureus TaxID=48587 RepID=A0A9P7DSA0_9AGAM|nr:uncharacterized protein BJ212DRAFT_1487525 [Suillus subaureus]KAG1801901.1 hypothetical protein BJ212DRAFT_1487525 [Suillus subaureus]
MSNKTIQIQLPSDVEEVKKRDQKKFAYLVSRGASDADDVQGHGRKNIAYSVAEDLSDAEDVEKRVEKTLASIVSEESRDVQGVVEVSSTAPIRHFWAVIYKS